MTKKDLISKIIKNFLVGKELDNPGGGTSKIIEINENFIEYQRENSKIKLQMDDLFDAYCEFKGKYCYSTSLKEYKSHIFDSNARPAGHSCNCTFFFIILHKLNLSSEILGGGVKGDPFWVEIYDHEIDIKNYQNFDTPTPINNKDKFTNNDIKKFHGKSPINPYQKCLCVLVLDVSGSMIEDDKIKQLNIGLRTFQEELQNDNFAAQRLEIAIVTFNSTVNVIVEPTLILENNFNMPILIATGSTKLVDGVRIAISTIEERKEWYRNTGIPYFRPWIVLITDGEPDPDQNMVGLSHEIKEKVDDNRFLFYAVGVKGYNHNKLLQICHKNTPPLPLRGLEFSLFFKWLSNSLGLVSRSQDEEVTKLPPTSSWVQISN